MKWQIIFHMHLILDATDRETKVPGIAIFNNISMV